MVRKKITTNNREIYNEFSNLNLSSYSRIILETAKINQVKKIISDTNRNEKFLDMEMFGDKIIIKKLMPVKFDVYLSKKIRKII